MPIRSQVCYIAACDKCNDSMLEYAADPGAGYSDDEQGAIDVAQAYDWAVGDATYCLGCYERLEQK